MEAEAQPLLREQNAPGKAEPFRNVLGRSRLFLSPRRMFFDVVDERPGVKGS
jgi:hypothetical protein